ncbi:MULTISPECIES: hypothetical protein [unclassified Streptomyces]|uniref:hypothetical protein n=1 Tax=unclassified Streptomyces TaxID=2593676 RepID=UPI002E295D9F|nr:hypothetical protein [Streptomyces sp. NBC_01429]
MSSDLLTPNLFAPNLLDPRFMDPRFMDMKQWAVSALAQTGTSAERLWLLGGVALALTGAGVVAVAATRGRRD